MSYLNFIWDYVILFLVVLTVLVFVHELGHYLVARYNNVRVEVFSIGFGPEIYGWTDRVGTRWKISAIPLGGYVKMFGEKDAVGWGEDDRLLPPEEKAVSFHYKRLSQRAAIVVAGPVANFLFAIVVLAGLFAITGSPAPLAGVGSVIEDSAAAEAGFQPGDRIFAVGGEPIEWFDDLRVIVSASPEKRLTFDVLRGEERLALTAVPRMHDLGEGADPRQIGLLGVRPDPAQVGYERHDPLSATWMAAERTAALTGQILSYLGQIITGARNTEELGGPLRIAQMSGDMAQGGLVNLILFMAALSVNLGLVNLLPIPMLDGGHLFFYAFEAVLRRPLSDRIQELGFRFGLILVLLLMVFATWNDLVHLNVFQYLKQLMT